MKRIDYDLVYDERDRQWLVWTPDKTGGVIGSGAARTTALRDAILNLAGAIAQMKNEVQALLTEQQKT